MLHLRLDNSKTDCGAAQYSCLSILSEVKEVKDVKTIFIDLRLPQKILEIRNYVQQGLRGARLFKSDNLDLTLRFLGEINEPKLSN